MTSKQIIHKIIHGQLAQLIDYIEDVNAHAPEIGKDLSDIYTALKDLRIQILKKDEDTKKQ